MSVKPIIPYHPFSDADFIAGCLHIHSCALRDLQAFQSMGESAGSIAEFEKLINQFSDFPTDDELEAWVNFALENKDGIADILLREINTIRTMAKQQYRDENQWKTFGFEGMEHLPDANLAILTRRIFRIGKHFLPELKNQGLTSEILEELDSIGNNFVQAMILVNEAVEYKMMKTNERVKIGNNLYAMLIRLSSVGKLIIENMNDVRYNDYVLYHEKAVIPATAMTA